MTPSVQAGRRGQLGELPAHWKVMSLKWLASLRSGEAITSESIQSDGKFPVYGGNGLRGFADAHTHNGHFVLIGRQGALCGNVNFAAGQFWASEHAVVVAPRTVVNVRWLGELLRTMNLNQYSVAAAQPGLAVERIVDLRVPVPPLAEQNAIGSLIDRETARIDALIEKKTRFIELLREKRQALVTEAVTFGMDSKAPRRPTGIDWLGSIPSHWAVRPLKYIAAVQTGVAKGKDYAGVETQEVPYLRVANVQDGFLDLGDVATIEVAASEVGRYLLRAGDVLMNEGGDFDKLGRGHVWQGEIHRCIHQNHVFAVRPTRVTSEWLNVFTGSKPAQFHFMARSKQSTNLASISSSNLMELMVPIPPPAEQGNILRALALKLERADALRDATERSLVLLRERRAAVITAAVTGQIDARTEQLAEAVEPA